MKTFPEVWEEYKANRQHDRPILIGHVGPVEVVVSILECPGQAHKTLYAEDCARLWYADGPGIFSSGIQMYKRNSVFLSYDHDRFLRRVEEWVKVGGKFMLGPRGHDPQGSPIAALPHVMARTMRKEAQATQQEGDDIPPVKPNGFRWL